MPITSIACLVLCTCLYSIWTAVIGCTLYARRSVVAEHSDSPRYLTFPSLTNSAIAVTVSSIGLTKPSKKRSVEPQSSYNHLRVLINSVQIVQINVIRSQAFKWSSTRWFRILRLAIDVPTTTTSIYTKFGSEEYVLSSLLENFRNDSLTVPRSIDIY